MSATTEDLADLIDRFNLSKSIAGIGYDIATVRAMAEGCSPETIEGAYRFLDAVAASAHAEGYRKGYEDGRFDAAQNGR